MYEDAIIDQIGSVIEEKIKSCQMSNTMETVQSTLAPISFEPPKPIDRKMQPKEKIRLNDNMRIEDILRGSKDKQLEAFLPGDTSKPLHPIAESLLKELQDKARLFKGKDEY